MVLGGYFDESERQENDEPICVGGFFFKPAAYVKFRRDWHRTVLRYKQRRFTHFHTTDLCAGQREYKGLEIADRVVIMNRAVDAIDKHSYAMLAVQFDKAEFERVAPATWPLLHGSIYTAACQMCLQTAGYWLTKWQCPMRVLYVFERGHKFQREADAVMRGISDNEEAQRRFHYRNHIFEEKTKECGLQAADLFAWATTKTRIGRMTPAFRPFLPAIMRMAATNRTRQKLYPFTGDRLKRFIDEQMAANPIYRVDVGPRRRSFK